MRSTGKIESSSFINASLSETGKLLKSGGMAIYGLDSFISINNSFFKNLESSYQGGAILMTT